MKARLRPSKKLVAQLEEDVYAATVEACEDNNAFFLMALNQEFGFGPERLKRMIHKYNELSEEYTVMRSDGFTYEEIHQKMCDALISIGIDPDQVYVGKNDFYDIQRQKKYCEQCIHFFYHDLYDENNHTECCCKLHLEGKNRGEWSYLCVDFVKCETAEQHEIKRAGLMKYASYKQMEKCSECGKKWRWLYGDICGVCYEKKRKKADEIARGFKAEGWKEVPEKERENATYSLGGWIDERDMDAFEPRVGTRYFLIDVRHLTWRFFFRKEA